MKKQRIYFYTSVFGGYFDSEFEEFTKPLFERINKGEFKVLLSAVLQRELEPAPEKIEKRIHRIPWRRWWGGGLGNGIYNGKSCRTNKLCGLSAYRTCNDKPSRFARELEFLVSWNFKHIVNIERIRGYNSINIKNGYKQLEIRSPRDLMDYGN